MARGISTVRGMKDGIALLFFAADGAGFPDIPCRLSNG
jgi:hypothetical protein